MNKHVVNHFNQWLSDKPIGFEFTAYDVMDRLKAMSPKHTPSTATIGHLIKMCKRCERVSTSYGVAVYEVVA